MDLDAGTTSSVGTESLDQDAIGLADLARHPPRLLLAPLPRRAGPGSEDASAITSRAARSSQKERLQANTASLESHHLDERM